MIRRPEIIIVTGLSGAGRSTAIKSIEDFGGFCVDNMPAALIEKFIGLLKGSDFSKSLVALGVDVRSRGFMEGIPGVFSAVENMGYESNIIFLESSDSAIIRRYSESRHRHPLSCEEETLPETIKSEREQLAPLRERARHIIDTTALTPHELKKKLRDILFEGESDFIHINIIAFGFKYGIPEEADMIIDTRFLPNPHYDTRFSFKTGKDRQVRDFIMKEELSMEFVQKYRDLLDFLLPNYVKEGKSYLNIGVGCTGGRHRSVTIASIISKHIEEKGHRPHVTNRDIDRK